MSQSSSPDWHLRGQRLMFSIVGLAVFAGVAIVATVGAPAQSRPQLVTVEEAAAAPASLPEAPHPVTAVERPAQPVHAGEYELPIWLWEAPEAQVLVSSSVLAADPSDSDIANFASGSPAGDAAADGEELATTAPEPQSTASRQDSRTVEVEHQLSTIPDPPDVGACGRTKSFETERLDAPADPWAGVRRCESHNNYSTNTGNSFYGAYQFTISTWNWVAAKIDRADLVGLRPDLATPSDQDRMAQALGFEIDGGGLGHWPVCGRFYG
jgi:hypothetical protein